MTHRYTKPICSVCIANFNGIGIIEKCIRSVLRQDFDYDFEIIVHDDASTDGSTVLIEEKFPEITLIKNERNIGFCKSNNKMVNKANGFFILLLNNDAELYPDALKTLYSVAIKNPNSVLSLPQFNADDGRLIDRGQFFDFFLNPIPNVNPNIENVGMVSGSCFWTNKKLWTDIDGFPKWYHSFAEDLFFCCVARLKGYTVQCINKSGYKHWIGSSYGGGKVKNKRLYSSIRRRRLSEVNKTNTMVICYPYPIFIIVFPVHLFFLICEGLIISVIEKDLGLFKSIYANVFSELRANQHILIKNRKKIQRQRAISIKVFFNMFKFIPFKLRLLLSYGIPHLR